MNDDKGKSKKAKTKTCVEGLDEMIKKGFKIIGVSVAFEKDGVQGTRSIVQNHAAFLMLIEEGKMLNEREIKYIKESVFNDAPKEIIKKPSYAG